ncbi:hypothetical protein JL720_4264 [Aureococcus anophagefferens]|nr:hypothetical protein JL720_4264 [Aureococcus anophagefferens]
MTATRKGGGAAEVSSSSSQAQPSHSQPAPREAARRRVRSSSSDDESDDGSASSGDDDGAVAPAVVAEGVLASLRDERIAPLAPHLLPQVSAKRARRRGTLGPGGTRGRVRAACPAVVDEARKLVAAAAASEKVKRPFACRLCAFAGDDLASFEAHRDTELHKVATKVWQDASYCKLCRAQCTSPNELAVHLRSKKHLERSRRSTGANLHVPRSAKARRGATGRAPGPGGASNPRKN